MKEVIIIGAGGFARELESWIKTPNPSVKYHLVGFLDDNLQALDSYGLGSYLIGKINWSTISRSQSIICAVMNPEFKRGLYLEAQTNKIDISDFLHTTVLVGLRSTIGTGMVAFPNVIISCDVTVGDLVFINCGTQVGHDVEIGSFTSIMANVDIGGGAKIGEGVFIGSNAVILPGITVPDKTRIGAGSVVMRNIKEPGTYFGNPAKKIF